jgi:hypothetical protein
MGRARQHNFFCNHSKLTGMPVSFFDLLEHFSELLETPPWAESPRNMAPAANNQASARRDVPSIRELCPGVPGTGFDAFFVYS